MNINHVRTFLIKYFPLVPPAIMVHMWTSGVICSATKRMTVIYCNARTRPFPAQELTAHLIPTTAQVLVQHRVTTAKPAQIRITLNVPSQEFVSIQALCVMDILNVNMLKTKIFTTVTRNCYCLGP